MRKAVGAHVQHAVSERLVLVQQGQRVRMQHGLQLELRVHGQVVPRGTIVAALAQQGIGLRGRQQAHAIEHGVRPLQHGRQHIDEIAGQRRDACPVKQGCAVFQAGRHAIGADGDIEREVELGLDLRFRQQADGQAVEHGHGGSGRAFMAQVEQDLEQRIARQVALDAHRIEQQLEWQLGVVQRGQRLAAQAAAQGARRQAGRQARAVDLGIDEKTDQLMHFVAIAARVRHADGKVALAAQATEHQLPGRHQDDERRALFGAAKRQRRAGQRRRQRKRVAAGRLRGRGAVGQHGQIQRRHVLPQVGRPVGQFRI
ncbi:hypothetical protein JANLI_12940 [Janthinobacterium lividum]|nr:hypothetical protein JANLI_12940 [Janthinobacterium lividum]